MTGAANLPTGEDGTAAVCGMASVVALTAGVIVGIAFYNRANSQPYSLLNHFASELGWARSNPNSWVYNSAVVVASLALLPMVRALGRRIGGRLGAVAARVGLVAALGGCAAGLLPMDRLWPHLAAAAVFFWGWLFAVCLMTWGFWRETAIGAPEGRRGKTAWALIGAGLMAIAACAVFLALPKRAALDLVVHPARFQRPAFWRLAAMEWAVLLTMGVWVSTAAVGLWREQRPPNKGG